MEPNIQNFLLGILKEILDDTVDDDDEFRILNILLTNLLKKSNTSSRNKLRSVLKNWEIRILFVDSLQEEAEKQNLPINAQE